MVKASIRSLHWELSHAFVSWFAQENGKIRLDGNDRVLLTHLLILICHHHGFQNDMI